jgi:hypothetical protein
VECFPFIFNWVSEHGAQVSKKKQNKLMVMVELRSFWYLGLRQLPHAFLEADELETCVHALVLTTKNKQIPHDLMFFFG